MKQLVLLILTLISISQFSYCSISHINLNVKEKSLVANKEKNQLQNQIKSLAKTNLNINLKNTIKNHENNSNITSKKKLKTKKKNLSQLYKSTKGKGKGKKKSKKSSKKKVLWEGWLKFISLTDKKSPMVPNKFYVNPEFKYQKLHHIIVNFDRFS